MPLRVIRTNIPDSWNTPELYHGNTDSLQVKEVYERLMGFSGHVSFRLHLRKLLKPMHFYLDYSAS